LRSINLGYYYFSFSLGLHFIYLA